jgi:lysozyme family protein
MHSAFDAAWRFIQQSEGGGVTTNDPDDPGGLTKWGISKRAFPEVDIALLTENGARQLFRDYYWTPCQCELLPPQIAVAVADAAFNQGVRRATVLLQRALRVEEDSIVGPETIAAAERAIPKDLLMDFLSHRAVAYAGGKPKYIRGWMRRLFSLQLAVLEV